MPGGKSPRQDKEGSVDGSEGTTRTRRDEGLISSILQAEKLGIGLVQVLRVQSHEVREEKEAAAEEEAMKAPIKMLFPLVLFIFPSIFIVLLGPAAIQFIEVFSNNKP